MNGLMLWFHDAALEARYQRERPYHGLRVMFYVGLVVVPIHVWSALGGPKLLGGLRSADWLDVSVHLVIVLAVGIGPYFLPPSQVAVSCPATGPPRQLPLHLTEAGTRLLELQMLASLARVAHDPVQFGRAGPAFSRCLREKTGQVVLMLGLVVLVPPVDTFALALATNGVGMILLAPYVWNGRLPLLEYGVVALWHALKLYRTWQSDRKTRLEFHGRLKRERMAPRAKAD